MPKYGMGSFREYVDAKNESIWDTAKRAAVATGYGALGAMNPFAGAYYGARTGWADAGAAGIGTSNNNVNHASEAMESLQGWMSQAADPKLKMLLGKVINALNPYLQAKT